MHRQTIRHGLKILALTLALLAPRALAAEPGALPLAAGAATAQMASPQAISEYRRKRSEEHTSELQSRVDLVCRLLLEKKKKKKTKIHKTQTRPPNSVYLV